MFKNSKSKINFSKFWLLKHKKLRDLDSRWEALPSAEKMHVAHAAFRKQSMRNKVAAVATSGSSVASGEESIIEATTEAAVGFANSREKEEGPRREKQVRQCGGWTAGRQFR